LRSFLSRLDAAFGKDDDYKQKNASKSTDCPVPRGRLRERRARWSITRVERRAAAAALLGSRADFHRCCIFVSRIKTNVVGYNHFYGSASDFPTKITESKKRHINKDIGAIDYSNVIFLEELL